MDRDASGDIISESTYVCEALGNRIARAVATSSGTTTQRYAYDRGNIWADLDGGSSLTIRYMLDDGGDYVAQVTAGGAIFPGAKSLSSQTSFARARYAQPRAGQNARYAIFEATGLKGPGELYTFEQALFVDKETGEPLQANGQPLRTVIIRNQETNKIVRWGLELHSANGTLYGFDFYRSEDALRTDLHNYLLLMKLGPQLVTALGASVLAHVSQAQRLTEIGNGSARAGNGAARVGNGAVAAAGREAQGYSFALGLGRHPAHGRGNLVERFAKRVVDPEGAEVLSYSQIRALKGFPEDAIVPNGATLENELFSYMAEAKHLHFNLDGVVKSPDKSQLEGILKLGQKGTLAAEQNVTRWEFFKSYNFFREKTTYYFGKNKVDVARILNE